MKKLFPALALLLAAAPAWAQFEGVLRMKFTTPQGGGTATVYVSPAGVRNETDFKVAGMEVKTAALVLKDKPGLVYLIRDDRKTYTELDMKNGAAGAADQGAYAVKDLGQEKVAGYLCRHVLVTHPRGGETELWTSRDILDYRDYAASRPGDKSGEAGEGFMKALRDAGADGFPMKSIHRGKKGAEGVTMELVKAEAKSLPGTLFQVPAGYQKTGSPGTPSGAMTPEARKAVDEPMKGMTPDKREMLEKMLKSRGLK